MIRYSGAAAIILATLAGAGHAAEPAARPAPEALAQSMRSARLSEGFQARMKVSLVQTDGRRAPPFKIAVIGQFSDRLERVLIRGISPDAVRHRVFAAERGADGVIRAVTYEDDLPGAIAQADPLMKLFGSDLVVWDMFGAWWNWPHPSLGGTERIGGRDCTIVTFQADSAMSPVREVISCIDEAARLALRTQFFGGRHKLLRTVSVMQTMRRESGAMAAKAMTITGVDDSITEVRVYSGDEHYLVTPGTFPSLDHRPAVDR
jgi:hypothetical protein